jgi:hypothetical protein
LEAICGATTEKQLSSVGKLPRLMVKMFSLQRQ